MRRTIIALVSATFVLLPIPRVYAQNFSFQLHKALEAQTPKPTNSTETTPVTPSPWQNARLLRTLKAHGSIYSAALSSDGNTLVSGGKNALEIWNLQTGESKSLLNWIPRELFLYTIQSIAISPDGQTFITGSQGTVTRSHSSSPGGCNSSDNSSSNSWSFSLNCSSGKNVDSVTGSDGGGAVQVWNLQSGEQLPTLADGENVVYTGSIILVNFSNDGQTLLSIGDSVISSTGTSYLSKIWDIHTGKVLQSFFTPQIITENPKINRDIAAYGDIGKWAEHLNGQFSVKSRPQSIAVSPDFQFIASLVEDSPSYTGIRLENLKTGEKRLLALASIKSGCITFSPDGKMVAASVNGTNFVWDISTGKMLYSLASTPSVNESPYYGTLAFSPDNQVLASRSDNKTIKLWDLRNGQLITTLTESVPETVTFLGFSPAGKTLICAGDDGNINFWVVQ